MNNRDRLKLFWKIFNYINKRFCNHELTINKIVFFKRIKLKKCWKTNVIGYYDRNDKAIGIRQEGILICQIDNLCHELTHAYQDQILNDKRGRHDKRGHVIYDKFLKEFERISTLNLNEGLI